MPRPVVIGRRDHVLRAASFGRGRQRSHDLEPAAIEALHEISHGLPRQINRLCDLALLVGFAEEHLAIGPNQIEAVSQDLVTIAAS